MTNLIPIEKSKTEWWSTDFRGVPNAFARSALFSVLAKQTKRVYSANEVVYSSNGISMAFTGMTLDQSDLDVLIEIFHLSKKSCGENLVEFKGLNISAYALLLAMNKNTGGKDIRWLDESLTRLQGAILKITVKGITFSGQLIGKIYKEENKSIYKIFLHEEIALLFNLGFARLPILERHKLKGKPLCKWLHTFYGSHDNTDIFKYSVETLLKLSGSKSSLKSFRQKLGDSLEYLAEITGWECEIENNDLVRVDKDSWA